ncbi:MAG: nitrile hydratase accessory protein [Pseudomonadota bacterium]
MAEASAAPSFEQPWHAEVFALTTALSEAGHFTWPEWSTAFANNLAADASPASAETTSPLRDTSHPAYFEIWLTTLEQLLAERSLAEPDTLQQVVEAWRAAYLRTPHGAPVRLSTD